MEIFYTEEADQDLTGIYDYIGKDNESAARSHVGKIRKRIDLLKDYPNFGKRFGKHKFIIAEKHKVFFLPPKDGVIYIVRVLHGKMDHRRHL